MRAINHTDIALIVIISASSYGKSKPPKPPTPKNICFVVNSKCPMGTLYLTITKFSRIQGINSIWYDQVGNPENISGVITNVSKGLWVEGYQINFGFWSKDSYRTYSAYDYLKEKLKREPTQAEINAVTEQELKSKNLKIGLIINLKLKDLGILAVEQIGREMLMFQKNLKEKDLVGYWMQDMCMMLKDGLNFLTV